MSAVIGKVNWLLSLALVGMVDATAATSRSVCKDAVELIDELQEDRIKFSAKSTCHVPIVVSLNFPQLVNFASSRKLPVVATLQPGATTELTQLQTADVEGGRRYSVAYRYSVGVQDAKHDNNYRYLFPYGGAQLRTVSQGNNGARSHTGSSRFAFDFALPMGTPIVAARGGIVLDVTDGHAQGEFNPQFLDKSNTVLIMHPDGSIGSYAHMAVGVVVRQGDVVDAGRLLGYSGNSGFSSGPHLHFQVSLTGKDGIVRSIPIKFVGDIVPNEGEAYAGIE